MNKGKEMKLSPLGDIPRDWCYTTISDALSPGSKVTYGVVQPGGEDINGVKFVRGGDIKSGKISNNLRTISHTVSESYSRTLLKGGEVLISLVGYPGQSAVVPKELAGANIARQVALLSLSDDFEPYFVHYFLSSELGQKLLLSNLNGSAQQVINLKDLAKVLIPKVLLKEQQKIAEILSTVDKKIDLIDQKIAETEKLKKGLMQKLFSEGVGVQDENGVWQPHTDFKPSGYPDCWKVMQLKSIANVITGKTPPPANTENYGGDYMFVSPSDLGSRKYISHTKSTLSKQGVNNGKVVPKGAIFFTCIGSTIGKIGISTQECCTNQQINTVILEKDGYMSEYVYYALSHISGSIKRLAGIQAVPIVKKSLFESQFIPIPPQEEQQLIAETLATVDLKLDILYKQKAETQQLKKGLMQKLLTGEWRVPVEETEAA
ncbi:restriction endonuclease subunit S [Vibrio diabolicus]|uniref:restriction endonuclease subunit S n=1 Tax=Vibrio diabolicus subgroup TaxID=2315253 RepID=UPI00211AC72B|nr:MULTISPECIES: restriction endonuclease subunit S [Vibrio diabolicus subgroup]MCG6239176.1 restriction endonuclease subunit S [Vibrio diabolicus]MCS0023728.1 restriction endonuclease subunit S [Vibrio antiquarius]UDY83315.1 restriction endonuclease subunit S [Vibrio diabolicus]